MFGWFLILYLVWNLVLPFPFPLPFIIFFFSFLFPLLAPSLSSSFSNTKFSLQPKELWLRRKMEAGVYLRTQCRKEGSPSTCSRIWTTSLCSKGEPNILQMSSHDGSQHSCSLGMAQASQVARRLALPSHFLYLRQLPDEHLPH